MRRVTVNETEDQLLTAIAPRYLQGKRRGNERFRWAVYRLSELIESGASPHVGDGLKVKAVGQPASN